MRTVARAAFSRRKRSGGRFGLPLDVYCGLEIHTDPRTYYWNGLERGGDPRHPVALFQYTLDGWGTFSHAGGPAQRVAPGQAFTAVIPSDHVYALPEDAGRWTFFWLMIHQPYVVQRLRDAASAIGPVMTIAPAGPLAARAMDLFHNVCRETAVDRFAHERLQFEFVLEYERHVAHALYPPDARRRALDALRGRVLACLDRPLSVEAIAADAGMSRSHFSHHFKAATGLSPARVMTELRLAEVKRRLIDGDDTLKSIAARTGFADVNHLCKVFRRHHHLSPGAFRKQMR